MKIVPPCGKNWTKISLKDCSSTTPLGHSWNDKTKNIWKKKKKSCNFYLYIHVGTSKLLGKNVFGLASKKIAFWHNKRLLRNRSQTIVGGGEIIYFPSLFVVVVAAISFFLLVSTMAQPKGIYYRIVSQTRPSPRSFIFRHAHAHTHTQTNAVRASVGETSHKPEPFKREEFYSKTWKPCAETEIYRLLSVHSSSNEETPPLTAIYDLFNMLHHS